MMSQIVVGASFNTQPRRGGCRYQLEKTQKANGFNTQPRRGGCAQQIQQNNDDDVSTHSRAEAAAIKNLIDKIRSVLFQHTAAQRRLLPT